MLARLITQLLAFGLVAPCLAEEINCYAPDGKTLAPNETYVPCNKLGITQSGVFSSCCRLDGDPDNRDLCTASGLCLKGGIITRGYCTDKSWDSPACVDVCTTEEEGGSAKGTAELTSCTDGTYCCGHNNLTCCGTDWAVVIPTQPSVMSDEKTESATQSKFKNATFGLAALAGALLIAAGGGIVFLLRKNKTLYAQLHDQASKPGTAEQTDLQNLKPGQDPWETEGMQIPDKDALQREYEYLKGEIPTDHLKGEPPASPAISEIDGVGVFSELEGSEGQPRPDLSRLNSRFSRLSRPPPPRHRSSMAL